METDIPTQMARSLDRAAMARRGSPFLNTAQAAFYVGLAACTLARMRSRGDGPRFRRHGRHVHYHIDDLECWSQPPDPLD